MNKSETVPTLLPKKQRTIRKSSKLESVCYDIRGPVLREAHRLEEEGHKIYKLNIGNPAPWGFEAPEEILRDVIHNIPASQGYSDSHGVYSARKAVMQYYQRLGIPGVDVDDVYIGNGVSELVVIALQALINDGDEVLIPAPDFPLWTAAVNLCRGKPVHYRCDEGAGWQPDLDDIRSRITAKTRALVVINPNNPTGAVYEKAMLEGLIEIAAEFDLVLLADEIYDKIIYDDARYIPLSSLATDDQLVLTFSGLSKSYRVAGFRSGWLLVSGAKLRAQDYIEGLDILVSMRLCANVPAQHAIQTALGGYQSINDLVACGGRLHEQRDCAWELLNSIDGLSCVKPSGALYLFPKIDLRKFNISDDQKFVLDLLISQKVLVVQGTGFNWPEPDHFRVVFLPRIEDLEESIGRIEHFLSTYRQ
ncbi:MAG: pyridoxal phosphate-dependent aminotransferase [Gammaproteobacteria bacterium]|nr:pyridoxal phosphate-dependent aminotransferase [Gammaproteobacteria bacterium]MDH3447543.1 pyridoxal phosphate-dependent aminotransferase [Gammaproteobacteria bacterium]